MKVFQPKWHKGLDAFMFHQLKISKRIKRISFLHHHKALCVVHCTVVHMAVYANQFLSMKICYQHHHNLPVCSTSIKAAREVQFTFIVTF